jgi:Transposase DDE domain group 1
MPPSCWVGRLPGCPPRPGRGGSGCAPTPATSPENWPGRHCWPGSSSPSGRGGSRRGGASGAATAWTDAIDITGAQVAIAGYCPDWWPAATRLLIRRVALDVTAGQVSADPRARRRRTLHPDQRALPLAELATADAVYAYSFVVTNLDVSTPVQAAAVEHWYRHRTSIENIFKDAKLGAALRHLPSGYPQVNTAWMWAALLAANIAGWLHQLTATVEPGGRLLGHGVRGGQAMIATLRHRLIRIPARLIRHAHHVELRLPPKHDLLNEVLTRIRALPTTS